MGSDMILALQEASANRTTIFGLNHHAEGRVRHAVRIVPAMTHEPGENAHTSSFLVPQARQTFAVLGVQSAGAWGFLHGVNEHHVAVGMTEWQSRRGPEQTDDTGADLVRLALERSRSAYHAVEVLTVLLEHYGETLGHAPSDNIFVIADPSESFVLEASGRYWALIECTSLRAVTDAAMIRQDWRRLAPGLHDFAIERGWWQDDGNKLDFVRCLGQKNDRTLAAQKRWGHQSLALAQQQGAIDLYFLRRMLADQEQYNRHLYVPETSSFAGSFLIDLQSREEPILAWVAFGPPQLPLYFPLCLNGDLPVDFGDSIPVAPSIQERLIELHKATHRKERDQARLLLAIEKLQVRFDQDAEEFQLKARELHTRGQTRRIADLATDMMRTHAELFATEHRKFLGREQPVTPRPAVAEEVLFFA
jgi:hypothetical protein